MSIFSYSSVIIFSVQIGKGDGQCFFGILISGFQNKIEADIFSLSPLLICRDMLKVLSFNK